MQTRTTQIIVLIAALLLGINNPSKAQTTSWNWMIQTESTNGEVSQGAFTDAQGNIYHAGTFADSFNLQGNTIRSWGQSTVPNGYVSRFSPGAPASNNWTLVMGSRGASVPLNDIRGLSVDQFGNSYFYYYEFNFNQPGDTIQIGPNNFWIKTGFIAFIETSLLVKVDPQGNVVWFKSFDDLGAIGGGEALYTATDSQGNLYLTGLASGSLTLDTINLSSLGHFITKIDPTGNFVWAKTYAGTGRNLQVEVNSQDEVFVSGAWAGDTLTMDNFTVINPTPSSAYDRYIAKFSSAGQTQWLVNESGQGQEYAAALAPKASGGLLCFSIIDTAAALKINNGAISVNAPGMVLTQYDAQGNFQSYTKYPLSSGINEFSKYLGGVISGDENDFFMSTKYSDAQVDLDGTILTNTAASSGTFDAIIAKIDTMGHVLWATSIGAEENEEIFSIDYSSNYGLTIAGTTFSSEVILGNDTVTNAGFLTSEAFVANLSYNGIGLNEINKAEKISFYPNPTSGQLFFNLEDTESERITLKVQNLTGQIVLEKRLDTENGEQILDVQQLILGFT